MVLIALTTYLKRRPAARTLVVILGGLALLASPVLWWTSSSFLWFWLTVPMVVFWLGGLMASDEFEIDLPAAKETRQREAAEARVETAPRPATPEEMLELNAKRLSEYYVINQAQVRSGFRWAILVMLGGFATLVTGVSLFYFRAENPNNLLTGLSVAAGIVTDLVGGLFLYLNAQTQQLSLWYADRLGKTQQVMLAIRLVDSHEDAADRAKARDRVIDNLLRAAAQPDLLVGKVPAPPAAARKRPKPD